MCLPCLPLAGDLPASKTHAVRRWAWLRNADPHALADGVLTVTLRRSARPGVKSEDDSYDVAEQPEAVRGWRRFHLVNLSHGEVYEVVLGGRGDTCTCPAGAARLPNCKHRDALRAVVAAGGFERPEVAATFERVVAVETVPATDCLICGETMGVEDAEVHRLCELFVGDMPDCFRGIGGAWAGVPF